MRRISVILAALLLAVMLCPAVYADSDSFSCKYIPKSERSSMFYIDVYSDKEICGTVAELSFNKDYADLRSVTAESSEDSVRYNNSSGVVRIAFASDKAKSGRLFRLGFMALRMGSCDFTLKVVSAADGSLSALSGFSPYTLTVTFDKNDVSVPSGGSASSGGRYAAGASSRGSGISVDGDEDDGGSSDTDITVSDIRDARTLTYILLGAGGTVLLGLIAAMIILYIRRRRNARKDNASDKPDDAGIPVDSEPEDEPDELSFAEEPGFEPYPEDDYIFSEPFEPEGSADVTDESFTELNLVEDPQGPDPYSEEAENENL